MASYYTNPTTGIKSYIPRSQLPTSGVNGANSVQQGINRFLGTDYGNTLGMQSNNTYAYTNPSTGAQEFTGKLDASTIADVNSLPSDSTSNASGGMIGGVGSALAGLGTVSDLMKGWAAIEGVNAQKKANAENKANNIANFNMSADQFNAQIERANNINNQLAGMNQGVAGYVPPKVIETVQKRG